MAATLHSKGQKKAQQQDASDDIPQELLSEDGNTVSYQAPEEDQPVEPAVVQESSLNVNASIPEFIPSSALAVNGSDSATEEYPSEITVQEAEIEKPEQSEETVPEETVDVKVSVPINVEEPQQVEETEPVKDEVAREEEKPEATVEEVQAVEVEEEAVSKPQTEETDSASPEPDAELQDDGEYRNISFALAIL